MRNYNFRWNWVVAPAAIGGGAYLIWRNFGTFRSWFDRFTFRTERATDEVEVDSVMQNTGTDASHARRGKLRRAAPPLKIDATRAPNPPETLI